MPDLKKLGRDLTPIIRIGKSGITDNILEEVKRQLKKRKIIKIRVLRSALETDVKAIATKCAELSGGELVNVVGLTFLLFKAKKL